MRGYTELVGYQVVYTSSSRMVGNIAISKVAQNEKKNLYIDSTGNMECIYIGTLRSDFDISPRYSLLSQTE